MEFSAKEDIEAPIADVFGILSDFEGFERSAIRRGVDVLRRGDVSAPDRGLAWDTRFSFRGKERALRISLTGYEPVTAMTLTGEGSGLDGQMQIELLALSPRRTRMSVRFGIQPKTLSARLLVQSLKLAKTKLTRKFKLRVAEFAKSAEDRLGRTA